GDPDAAPTRAVLPPAARAPARDGAPPAAARAAREREDSFRALVRAERARRTPPGLRASGEGRAARCRRRGRVSGAPTLRLDRLADLPRQREGRIGLLEEVDRRARLEEERWIAHVPGHEEDR